MLEQIRNQSNEGALLSTSISQHNLIVYFHTPQLSQCLQSILRHSRLKQEEHEKSKQTVVPILIQTPKTNTENLYCKTQCHQQYMSGQSHKHR